MLLRMAAPRVQIVRWVKVKVPLVHHFVLFVNQVHINLRSVKLAAYCALLVDFRTQQRIRRVQLVLKEPISKVWVRPDVNYARLVQLALL